MNKTINNFSRVLCALLLCAGMVMTSCEETNPVDDNKTEQGGNEKGPATLTLGQVTAATDLSSSTSANCYIISESGLYKFKTVKGNSNESVGNIAL